MDRLEELRRICKCVLKEWAEFGTKEKEDQDMLVFDEKSDNYLWVSTGFSPNGHHFYITTHFGIRNGKIYIFRNGVEEGLVEDLLEAGATQQEIVLAWQPMYRRELSPFPVA